MIETLTAETFAGRQAIEEVMRHSYCGDIDDVPPAWARARVVDGVPVSFILVDPRRQLDFPGADLPYAFICDVATREDRRGEGHFAALMRETFDALRAAGCALVLTHGRHQLYRRFGFDVFTHHCGIFVTPEQIERRLGLTEAAAIDHPFTVHADGPFHADLLLVDDAQAATLPACRAVLRSAAAVARERGKRRVLFEHPHAPSYGSRYPIYASLRTRLASLAQACGAEVRIQQADPEAGTIPDADWIKVLHPARLLQQATRHAARVNATPLALCVETESGAVTLQCDRKGLRVREGNDPAGAHTLRWPSGALAQLVTGYQSAQALARANGTLLAPVEVALLNHLFPTCWRLSRNESWTFKT